MKSIPYTVALARAEAASAIDVDTAHRDVVEFCQEAGGEYGTLSIRC